eukprot:62331-Amphidinium_carterae.1
MAFVLACQRGTGIQKLRKHGVHVIESVRNSHTVEYPKDLLVHMHANARDILDNGALQKQQGIMILMRAKTLHPNLRCQRNSSPACVHGSAVCIRDPRAGAHRWNPCDHRSRSHRAPSALLEDLPRPLQAT